MQKVFSLVREREDLQVRMRKLQLACREIENRMAMELVGMEAYEFLKIDWTKLKRAERQMR